MNISVFYIVSRVFVCISYCSCPSHSLALPRSKTRYPRAGRRRFSLVPCPLSLVPFPFSLSPFPLSSVRRKLAPRRPILPEPQHVVGLHDLVNLAGALVDHGPFAVAIKAAD